MMDPPVAGTGGAEDVVVEGLGALDAVGLDVPVELVGRDVVDDG